VDRSSRAEHVHRRLTARIPPVHKIPTAGLAFLVMLLASCLRPAGVPDVRPLDAVVLHGRVIDPESGLDAVRNVGIRDGRIVAVSTAPLQGRDTIDATGLVVAPGFIDTDTYPENAELQLLDGVTTGLSLLVGTADVEAWYAARAGRMPIHYGVAVDYSQVRAGAIAEHVFRHDARAPWREDRRPVLDRLARGLSDGAVGVTLGLGATLAVSGAEIFDTFRVAAETHAPVTATLPDVNWDSGDATANLAQVIGAAAATGAVIHIPHLLSSGGPRVTDMLRLMSEARARGVAVTAEDYPFRAAMGAIEPREADGWPDHELHEVQLLGTGERLTRAAYAAVREQRLTVWFHNDSIEPLLVEVLTAPFTSVASHGSPPALIARGHGHPRTSGTYSRLLGTYVREAGHLSLPDALRKASLLPAQRLVARVPGMARKGRVQLGADADLVVFDAARIVEQGTLDRLQPSKGMHAVLVQGTVVVRCGQVQRGVLPGRPIRAGTASPAG
jgi:hypothetical protein